jgi:hypothetical protein
MASFSCNVCGKGFDFGLCNCDSKPDESDVYHENGYRNRAHYLQCLAEDNDVELSTVQMLAHLLGPSEDFDGLVVAVEDGI